MRRVVGPGLAILVAFLVQTTLLPVLGTSAVAPDFVLATVVAIALVTGPMAAIGWGALGGLLQDSFSGGLIGLNGFSKPLVAFVVARLRVDPLLGASAGTVSAALCVLAASLVDGAILWALRAIIEETAVPGERWLALGLGLPFTVAAGVGVFRLLLRVLGRSGSFDMNVPRRV